MSKMPLGLTFCDAMKSGGQKSGHACEITTAASAPWPFGLGCQEAGSKGVRLAWAKPSYSNEQERRVTAVMTPGQEQRDQHPVVLEKVLPPGYGAGNLLPWELLLQSGLGGGVQPDILPTAPHHRSFSSWVGPVNVLAYRSWAGTLWKNNSQ